MPRGWKDWVRGLAIWGVGPDEELRLIRTDEKGYLQVIQVPHHHTHEDGGSDEINVQGLSGVLADLQRGKFSFVGNYADFPAPGEPERLAFAVDRLTIYRDTGTEWQKVATAHWDYIEGQPSEYFPAPHAATHEEGGADALTPANIGANWDKLVNKPSTFPPSAHASSHRPGGSDAIPTAAPAPITEGATGAEGSSTALARADHVHETPSEWTPKEHGNEKHSPDFLAVDGSNSPTGDVDWASHGITELSFLVGLNYGYGSPPLMEPFHNILAYADKKWTVTVFPSPTQGAIENMFDFAKSNYARWDNTVTLPVVITIEWSGWINLIKAVGIQFYWYQYISGVKIEAYDDYNSQWITLIDKSDNTNRRVMWTGNLDRITKIRYTLSGTYNEDYVSIANLFALSNHPLGIPYGYYLDVEGNMPMRGDLNMNGNDIVNPGLVDGVDVSAHAVRHHEGGADEIDFLQLKNHNHAVRHHEGGADEIDFLQLKNHNHAARHWDGGADELSVGKLEGTWGGATQIYNGSAPTVWTDLILSSYIGARRALVLIKVKNNGPYAQRYKFRPNGDTDDYTVASDQFQGTACIIASGYCGWIFVTTDADGKVEWATNNGYNSTLWLVGYIALS